jgi:hydrogenase-4 membrane subunit HyfE
MSAIGVALAVLFSVIVLSLVIVWVWNPTDDDVRHL